MGKEEVNLERGEAKGRVGIEGRVSERKGEEANCGGEREEAGRRGEGRINGRREGRRHRGGRGGGEEGGDERVRGGGGATIQVPMTSPFI